MMNCFDNTNKKIVFLSRMIPDIDKDNVKKNTKNGTFESAIAFQTKLIRGLDSLKGEHIILCNVEGVGSYPKHYKSYTIKKFMYSHNNSRKTQDYNVGYFNVVGIKQKSIEYAVLKQLEEIQRKYGISALIIYTPMTYFLNAAYKFKKTHENIHINLVIPDLPEFGDLSQNQSIKTKLYQKLQNRILARSQSIIDSMVFLTDQTADYMNWRNRPYCVIEGIADEYKYSASNSTTNYVLYTGTTHRCFGLPVLVEAFKYVQTENLELRICGSGDFDDELRRLSQTNPKIIFLGQVDHDTALKLQAEASILVNPRQNIGEYTKYSFPSKTMEYLATGNVVIAYKLDGVPMEYLDYLNSPRDDSPRAMAEKIDEIMQMSKQDRIQKGKLSRSYVLNYKNPYIQAKKILDLIER